MADFPPSLLHLPAASTINTAGLYCLAADHATMHHNLGGAGTWPLANRAIYVPVIVESYVTAYQMGFDISVQSGNYDAGIYDEVGTLLVSKGSTAVPVAGFAAVDIADTALTPGTYFLALAMNNTTVSVWRQAVGTAGSASVAGVQDQDTAFALPATATFSVVGASYVPSIAVAIRPTI